mmetsp:Transcript_69381/g.144687  ORF Transcript_69381/g.144687 Transcript_69381/m.144687 type:complete len:120 (+) Transcript_69381:113-472(+)
MDQFFNNILQPLSWIHTSQETVFFPFEELQEISRLSEPKAPSASSTSSEAGYSSSGSGYSSSEILQESSRKPRSALKSRSRFMRMGTSSSSERHVRFSLDSRRTQHAAVNRAAPHPCKL